MVLYFPSDASYLSEQKSQIIVVGNYFLSSILADPSKEPKKPTNDGLFHTKRQLLSHVAVSGAEAELGVLLNNGKPKDH